MKRIDINSNQLNFIGAWNLENNNLCNEIIDFFEKNQALQKKGGTSDASNNKKVKSTIDITIKPTNLEDKNFNVFNNYMKELHDCYLDYQKQWPFLKSMLNDIQIPPFNIQKYNCHILLFFRNRSFSGLKLLEGLKFYLIYYFCFLGGPYA